MSAMRRFFSFFLASIALTEPITGIANEAWPDKPIRWIVPFAPGGSTDILSRDLAKSMGTSLGVPVVVENRPGAGGSLGMTALSHAPADGYTIGMGSSATHSIGPHVLDTVRYDPRSDFAPLSLLVNYYNVLVVNPKLPVDSLQEFVAYGKNNPQALTFASAGNGSTNHLAGEVLKILTQIPMQHVPYKGSGPALSDVMAGHVSAMFDIPNAVLPQIETGKVKPLVIMSEKRHPKLPTVPTLAEAGVTNSESAGGALWIGMFAPPGTPAPIIARLNEALVKALHEPTITEKLSAQAFDIVGSSPEAFRTVINNDYDTWGAVVKFANIK